MVFKKGDPNIYRRKKKGNEANETSVSVGTNSAAILDVLPPIPLQRHGFDLVLGIRRIRSGNFTGLWELCELSNVGEFSVKRTLTDANIKPILIAQIGKVLSRCF